MIALLMACLFFEIFVQVLNLHQQKCALKLCSATLIAEQHAIDTYSVLLMMLLLCYKNGRVIIPMKTKKLCFVSFQSPSESIACWSFKAVCTDAF